MKLTIGGEPYSISFKTTFFDPPAPVQRASCDKKGEVKIGLVRAITRCSIAQSQTFLIDKVIALGSASCSVADEFNLHGGRRLALSRALDQLTSVHAERKLFWEAFLKTLPKVKPSYATLVRELKRVKHKLQEVEELQAATAQRLLVAEQENLEERGYNAQG